MMLVLVILTMLAAVDRFRQCAVLCVCEMIPKLAHSPADSLAYLTIPMLQASNTGRTLSPVLA